jgi:hypothetical protein
VIAQHGDIVSTIDERLIRFVHNDHIALAIPWNF